MASKQLGKLRQWAGEVISTRDKTIVSDEFKDLEHDVELRRQGLLKLHVTSEAYKDSLSKKKECEVLPGDKLLPLDSLGVVMIQHGEEFGDESAFGTSLVSLGRAHCQIATLQETFAISFEDTYLKAIKRSEADIKEYQNERKKLESRRLSYDAALAKYEKLKDNKNSKKDKERREAEDEYEFAKLRFEETQEDVEARMHNIQENEVTQLRDLTNLLNLEISFVQQHLDVLRDVKVNWIDEELISQMEASHKRTRRSPPPPAPPSVIPLSSSRSNEDEPAVLSRFNSTRSKSSQPPGTPKSHSRRSSKAASPIDTSSSSSESGSEGDSESDPAESDDGGKKKKGGLRERARSLTKRRKSDAGSKSGSRAPSRSASMKGRKRADSEATVGKDGKEKDKEAKEKDKDKDGKDKEKKKMSVTGWVSGFGKSKKEREREREREKFSALMDDRDDLHSDDDRGGDTEGFDVSGDEEFGARRPGSALSGSSKKSGGKDKDAQKKGGLVAGTSPKISTRLIRTSSTSNPPSPHPGNGASPHGSPVTSHTPLTYSPRKPKRKTVVALYDFTATTADELTFKIGDRIAVTNEVVDGWWMGEILNANNDIFGGRKGMFPTSYTKVLPDRPTPTGSSNSSSSSVASNSGLRPALSRRRKTEEPGSGRTSLDGLGTARPSHRTTLSTGAVPGKSYPYPSPTPSSSDHSFASVDDHPFEDSEHPFGDHHHYISSGRSPINGHFYAGSITGSEIEEYDDERGSLVNPSAPDFPVSFNGTEREKEKDVVAQLARRFSGPAPPVPPPPMTRRATDAAGSGKKPPPPPPPRRSANTASSTPTLSSTSLPPAAAPLPYIPRRPHTNPGTGGSSSTASSTTSSYLNIAQVGVGSLRGSGELDGIDSEGLTFSPFDDQVGCGSFKQNPFKAKGFCSNCMKNHS